MRDFEIKNRYRKKKLNFLFRKIGWGTAVLIYLIFCVAILVIELLILK